MDETSVSGLSELQKYLLAMLKWFHDFCEENKLRYYCLGGTMLGAMRHHGFIPWDDDVDIGMPRRDYERFAALMAEKQNARYVLETPDSGAPDFLYPISKLYDTKTTLVESKRLKVVRGLFLDIFPLDGAGEGGEELVAFYRPINTRYNLFLSSFGEIRSGRSFYKNASVALLKLVPMRLLNRKKQIARLNALCKRRDYDSSAWICNLLGAYRLKEAVPRAVMGKPTLYPFENISVYGAEDADSYLKHLFGDWRKLPPKEQQVTHHEFLSCRLDQPYK